MTFSPTFSLTYRDIVVGVLVVLLAFLLRVIVTFDRANNDPLFAPLPGGTDQRAYVDLAALYEAGQWPTEPFHWQPGVTYFLIAIRPLVGRTIGQMTLVMALVGALSCGFTVAVGWMVTHRRWGGYLTGLLLAIYPVSIFYSTVLLTESLASVYVVLFLFFAFWQREKCVVWRSVALGIVLGLMTITRTNLAVLWVCWVLLLWLDARSGDMMYRVPTGISFIAKLFPRDFVIHGGVSLVFMILVIAPVTLWNRQSARGSEFPLVTSTGMDEVYRGNNRDATGLRSTDLAMLTVDGNYSAALMSDIRRDPLRFVELQLRKSGLYWGATEPGNNVDYQQSGLAVSPLLRLIPLNFGILAFAGWLGIAALLLTDRRGALFFAIINLLIFAGVILVWTEGRLKQPAVPVLVVTSAYLLARLGEFVSNREMWRNLPTKTIGRYGLATIGLLVIFGGLSWAADNLPQYHPVGGLPADVRRLDITFGDRLKLVGWRTLPEWPAAELGWSPPQYAYVIQLYWQLLEPTPDDYNVYLAYVDNGARLAGIDRAIGTVSYRPKPTSQWQAGDIYSDILGFRLPKDAPLEQDAYIRLGVYLADGEPTDPKRMTTAVNATSLADQPNSIVLQRIGVFNTGRPGSILTDFTSSEAVFGDQIALKGYTLLETVTSGGNLNIGLYWQALREIGQDYTLFVHVEDENGKLVTQFDGVPRGNTLVTSTWPPDYPITDDVQVNMPDKPGLYHVYVGLYDSILPTHDRLFASTPDGRWLLGIIAVGN